MHSRAQASVRAEDRRRRRAAGEWLSDEEESRPDDEAWSDRDSLVEEDEEVGDDELSSLGDRPPTAELRAAAQRWASRRSESASSFRASKRGDSGAQSSGAVVDERGGSAGTAGVVGMRHLGVDVSRVRAAVADARALAHEHSGAGDGLHEFDDDAEHGQHERDVFAAATAQLAGFRSRAHRRAARMREASETKRAAAADPRAWLQRVRSQATSEEHKSDCRVSVAYAPVSHRLLFSLSLCRFRLPRACLAR